MRSVTHENLGIVIAYILPGFTALWGVSCFSQTVRMWLDTSASNSSTVGAFLFVTLTSLGLGVLANLIRALVVDPIQRRIGVPKRDWKYSQLQPNIAAVEFLVVNQFRYYQFAGNMFIVVAFAGICLKACHSDWNCSFYAGCLIAEVVLWLGARDNLRTYYRRLEEVLGPDSAGSVAPENSGQSYVAAETGADEEPGSA